VAAQKLAGMGARIIVVARHPERAVRTLARLREIAPSADHRVYYADVSRLSDIRKTAADIAAAEPRIDVLINNAGAIFRRRQLSADGIELTFATNHLSYFVLTERLLEPLLAARAARIINTSSDAHRGITIDFNDLQSAHSYTAFRAYSRSKLSNVLFTRELARRLEGTRVTVNCLHPGFVATRFGDQNMGAMSYIIRVAKKFFAISPAKGAETIVFLASSDDVADTSGKYFHQCRAVTPSKEALDDETARRLWEETAKLVNRVQTHPM
jgi:NAD(P)-dependent dehydrogenase (short-subunit alcohol dehydrogenase family)